MKINWLPRSDTNISQRSSPTNRMLWTVVVVLAYALSAHCFAVETALSDDGVEDFRELLDIRGRDIGDEAVASFIARYRMKLSEATRMEHVTYYEWGAVSNTTIREVYGRKGFSVKLVAKKTTDGHLFAESLIVSLPSPGAAITNRIIMPFDLEYSDGPETVANKLGRPERESIDRAGNGSVDYDAGPGTTVPLTIYFKRNRISGYAVLHWGWADDGDRSSGQRGQP